MRCAIVALVLTVACGPACGGDQTGGSTAGDEGGEAGDGGTQSSGDGDTTDEGGEGGSGGGSGGSGGGSGESTTSGDLPCPPDPMDTPCLACTKQHCCAQLEECESNAACACLLACLDGGNEYLLCLTSCDLTLSPPAFEGIEDCSQGPCADACSF